MLIKSLKKINPNKPQIKLNQESRLAGEEEEEEKKEEKEEEEEKEESGECRSPAALQFRKKGKQKIKYIP